MYTTFLEGGGKMKCSMCGQITEVPSWHFGSTDHEGRRLDRERKAEYKYGTFEFKLGREVSNTKVIDPAFVFCIDISSTSIINGFFHQVISTIK